MEEFKTMNLRLPKSERDAFYEQLYRCGILWGIAIPREPEQNPRGMIEIIARLTNLMRETPDEGLL